MHNIEHRTYPEYCDKNEVQIDLDEYVASQDRGEGCSGLSNDIRWLESAGVIADRDTAYKYLESHDRGWYDNLAVRFYAQKGAKSTEKRTAELNKRVRDCADRYRKLSQEFWPHTVKSDFVGCKHCGSKIKRTYLSTNFCPVCQMDLRPETTLNRLSSLKKSYDKAAAALKEHQTKNGGSVIKWLVKFEYHT